MPVFIKFNEHDKLTLSLPEVNDGAVANWVEKRLLEFLDAYLRIDRGGEDFDEEASPIRCAGCELGAHRLRTLCYMWDTPTTSVRRIVWHGLPTIQVRTCRLGRAK